MTGDLNMLMKFRDIQVMEDVNKKAELGYFDVEFTMYGCAYWDMAADKVFYKVSSNNTDIYIFIEESVKNDIFPSKVETMTIKCPVPIGAKELIAADVKKELAKELKKKYTKRFFEDLYEIASIIRNNTASPVLWERAEALEGVFDEEQLIFFENMIVYSYGCQKLNRNNYEQLKRWLEDEHKNMLDDCIVKDILKKTIYGFGYKENGQLKYFSNANKGHVYEKAFILEQNGLCVFPIFSKTYWYNYNISLQEIKKVFKEELKTYCETNYSDFTIIRSVLSSWNDEMLDKLNEIKSLYGEDAYLTAKRYFYRWGIIKDQN